MRKSIVAIIVVLAISMLASACIATGGNTQPTPNMTLTALFNPVVEIPATVTPIYVVVTNTPEPTAMPTNTEQSTNTAEPTNTTAAPTNTSAPVQPPLPGSRGNLMYAGKINFDPTIDGSWEDWKDYTTQYPVTYVVYGGSNWSGEADLKASYAAAWDEDYLYIGIKVHDDVYTQDATGENLYKGDSAEILLDANLDGDYYVQYLSSDDYQLGLSGGADGNHPEAYLWFPSSKAGSRSSVDVGFTSEDGLWRIEARIPWSVFGITPYKGMRLGIAVSVSDDDNKSSAIQQTMVSSAANRHLTNPTTWGEIVLN